MNFRTIHLKTEAFLVENQPVKKKKVHWITITCAILTDCPFLKLRLNFFDGLALKDWVNGDKVDTDLLKMTGWMYLK